MTYRNDHEAAVARNDALGVEIAEARRERDAAWACCRALAYRIAHPHAPAPRATETGELSTWWILLSVFWLGTLIAAIRHGLS